MVLGAKLLEVMRALAVLALVFLNFAHAPLAASGPIGDAWVATAASSFCGSPIGGDDREHAPCHACRIGGGADLPPPCAAPVPLFNVAFVPFAKVAEALVRNSDGPILGARGPPAA